MVSVPKMRSGVTPSFNIRILNIAVIMGYVAAIGTTLEVAPILRAPKYVHIPRNPAKSPLTAKMAHGLAPAVKTSLNLPVAARNIRRIALTTKVRMLTAVKGSVLPSPTFSRIGEMPHSKAVKANNKVVVILYQYLTVKPAFKAVSSKNLLSKFRCR